MLEPFFFDKERLFGCYHPASDINASRLLVICSPFFDEYRRCHSALGDLANACALQGIHVLRFDFFGTGESQGQLEDASVKGWIENIDTTIEEGVFLSGADKVILFGVRFGALLAAQSKNSMIKRYVFWDPIERGEDYVNWLNEINQDLRTQHLMIARFSGVPIKNIVFENFHITPGLKKGIASLKLNQNKLNEVAESYVVSTCQSDCSLKKYENIEFCGIKYNWPAFHDGMLTLKPALEAIAKKILAL